MLDTVLVDDVMSPEVTVVDETALATTVARTLGAESVGAVFVDTDPMGIVTQTDIVQLVGREADTSTATAGEIASAPVVTIDPDERVTRAAETMEEQDIKRLGVVSGGELVGIVTTTEVSNYLPELALRSVEEQHDLATELGVSYEDEDWEFDRVDTESAGELDPGDTVRFTKRLTDDDVRAFARACGDTNRLHLDEAFAAESQFGGRIVHGVLAVGLISAALARIPGLTIYISQDVSFRGPIAVDETATAVCEVTRVLGNDRYRFASRVYDEDGEMAIDGAATVLVTSLPE